MVTGNCRALSSAYFTALLTASTSASSQPPRSASGKFFSASHSRTVSVAARTAGNFSGRAEAAIPWLIRFGRAAGGTLIDSEIAEAPLRRGRFVYEHVELRFERISAASGPPPVAFAVAPDFTRLDTIAEPAEAAGGACP